MDLKLPMAAVVAEMTMSSDGFIADPSDGVGQTLGVVGQPGKILLIHESPARKLPGGAFDACVPVCRSPLGERLNAAPAER
jgi:hypothetical protein